jgi:hypothetical protein
MFSLLVYHIRSHHIFRIKKYGPSKDGFLNETKRKTTKRKAKAKLKVGTKD